MQLCVDLCGGNCTYLLVMRLLLSFCVKLNEWTDWDYWVNRISNNPNFDPRIYHPTLQK